jgi:NAD+ kinase
MGRMGFLSEGRPEDIVAEILSGEYTIESRAVLEAEVISDVNGEALMPPYAVNEMTIRRSGAAMLGIDVCVDGVKLPTYWGDGLVISTSSGSTAYSLSVGGPIVLPESKVLIISPIAPHNLNVRPLVVPDTSEIVLSTCSRDGHFELSADNRTIYVPETTKVVVKMAQFSLKRVRLNKSNFIQALTDKLYWGEDVRNIR